MEAAVSQNRSVLIVDDEPVICMGILKLIDWRQYGFIRTDIRYSFEEGLEAALAFPYSLIITDIRIHENNGLDLVKAVKQRRPSTDFVLISAYAEFEYARTAIGCGVKEYLLKPLSRSALEQCVSSLSRCGPEPSENAPGEAPESPPPKKAPLSKKSFKVREALDYLHRNYADKDLSLLHISKLIYVNPTYFGQCFIRYTGMRFSDYLNQYRIRKACELLEDDSHMTYEICEKVGFNNTTYFHRVFKKVTGLSTAEYKREFLLKGRHPPFSLPEKKD